MYPWSTNKTFLVCFLKNREVNLHPILLIVLCLTLMVDFFLKKKHNIKQYNLLVHGIDIKKGNII